jgi:hypothetical protein
MTILIAAGAVVAAIGTYLILRAIARNEAATSVTATFPEMCPVCDHARPESVCDCTGDCGRRYCKWATNVAGREFTRKLADMLEADSRG